MTFILISSSYEQISLASCILIPVGSGEKYYMHFLFLPCVVRKIDLLQPQRPGEPSRLEDTA
jgi:hypothetical protein